MTGSGYRELIERELASGSCKAGARVAPDGTVREDTARSAGREEAHAARLCSSCATVNDEDARFCKSCGRSCSPCCSPQSLFLLPSSFFLSSSSRLRAVPDARPEGDVGHPASGHGSAGRQRLGAADPRPAVEQHPGHPVELHAGGKVQTVKTDENGRAEFSGVAAGTTVKAVAVVDGERLESQEFPWPGDGGIRLMLVATAKGGDGPPPVFQPQPGNVVLGDQTRVIIELADDALAGLLPARYSEHRARARESAVGRRLRHADWRAEHDHAGRRAAGGRARRSRHGERSVCAGPDAVQVAYRMPV